MESKTKILFAAITAMLMCAGFVAVFTVPSPVGAGDVGGPLEAFNVSEDVVVNDVMWAPNGTWGVAVGTYHDGLNTHGALWQLSNIIPVEDVLAGVPDLFGQIDTSFNGLAYSGGILGQPGFYAVGSTPENFVAYGLGGVIGGLTPPPGNVLNNTAVDGVRLMAVGEGAISYYDGAAWYDLGISGGTVGDHVIHDVVYTNGHFVMVGRDTVGDKGVIYSVSVVALGDVTTNPNVVEIAFDAPSQSFLRSVDWINGNNHQYGLVVGSHGLVYEINAAGGVQNEDILDSNYDLRAVRFDANELENLEALIVGSNATSALILRYLHTSSAKGIEHVTGSPTADATPLCVAFKTYSSPRYAVVLGSGNGVVGAGGFRVNNVEVFQDIDVYTIYPHIDMMDLFMDWEEAGHRSVMNDKVDVNSGTLTLELLCRHDLGWVAANVERVDVHIWWDGGLVGEASQTDRQDNLDGQFANNIHTHFEYVLDTDTFAIVMPGDNEIELIGGSAIEVDANNYTLLFNFTLGKQVWASPAQAAVAPGPKSDQDQLNNATGGLATPYTWNIEAKIEGTVGGSEYRFDEFGVYKYAELTAFGLPGKFTGSGPPGSEISLEAAGNRDYMEYSVNCNYSIGVYLPDHLRNPSGNAFIDVTGTGLPNDGLNVTGGNIDTSSPFTGLGYGGVQWFYQTISPETSLNSTATNTADAGLNTPIAFTCSVEIGKPEDKYSGTLVYLLEVV